MTFKSAYSSRVEMYINPIILDRKERIDNFSIYIITLPKRMNYVKNMIKKYKLQEICNVKIVDAVLKKDINLNDSFTKKIVSIDKLNNRLKKSVNQSILGQLGCYMSHLKVFDIFMNKDRNDNLLVLEDDFIFEKGVDVYSFKRIINKLINENLKYDIINIGPCWRNCKKDNIQNINNYLTKDFGKCTHSLLTNKRGINNILKYMYPIDMALDDKYDYLTSNRFIIGYSLINRLFDQNSKLESNIQSRTLTPKCV